MERRLVNIHTLVNAYKEEDTHLIGDDSSSYVFKRAVEVVFKDKEDLEKKLTDYINSEIMTGHRIINGVQYKMIPQL